VRGVSGGGQREVSESADAMSEAELITEVRVRGGAMVPLEDPWNNFSGSIGTAVLHITTHGIKVTMVEGARILNFATRPLRRFKLAPRLPEMWAVSWPDLERIEVARGSILFVPAHARPCRFEVFRHKRLLPAIDCIRAHGVVVVEVPGTLSQMLRS